MRVRAQSCPTLCDPADCSPTGSVLARALEWVAISSSRGSSPPRDRTCLSSLAGRFFITEPPGKLLSLHQSLVQVGEVLVPSQAMEQRIRLGHAELQPLNIRSFQTEGTAFRLREQHSDRGNSTQTEGTSETKVRVWKGTPPPPPHIPGRSPGCSSHLLDGASWAASSCRICCGRELDLSVGEIAIM